MTLQRPIDRDLARGTDRDVTVASPPDDAGHMGEFTVPADTMQVQGAERTEGPTPPTHYDPTRTGTFDRQSPQRGLGVATGTILIIALVALAVIAVMLVAGG